MSDSDQDKAEKPVKLVHYTTAEAAFKILNNQKIWMRQYDLLNDQSELIYAINYFNREILPHQISKIIGQPLSEQDKMLLTSEGKTELLLQCLKRLIEKKRTSFQ